MKKTYPESWVVVDTGMAVFVYVKDDLDGAPVCRVMRAPGSFHARFIAAAPRMFEQLRKNAAILGGYDAEALKETLAIIKYVSGE